MGLVDYAGVGGTVQRIVHFQDLVTLEQFFQPLEILTHHVEVDVVIPGDESMVTIRSQQGSAGYEVLDIVCFADLVEIRQDDVQAFMLLLEILVLDLQ